MFTSIKRTGSEHKAEKVARKEIFRAALLCYGMKKWKQGGGMADNSATEIDCQAIWARMPELIVELAAHLRVISSVREMSVFEGREPSPGEPTFGQGVGFALYEYDLPNLRQSLECLVEEGCLVLPECPANAVYQMTEGFANCLLNAWRDNFGKSQRAIAPPVPSRLPRRFA